MSTTPDADERRGDAWASEHARRVRLRELTRLSPGERLERLNALSQQLTRLRDDARRSRAAR